MFYLLNSYNAIATEIAKLKESISSLWRILILIPLLITSFGKPDDSLPKTNEYGF